VTIKRKGDFIMGRKIELHNCTTKETLIKNGFKEFSKNHFIIWKELYKSLIVLRMEADLNEREIIYDVIDRNTQTVYYPFWNNVNGENNLVAIGVSRNFDNYIKELQDKKILKRFKKKGKR